MTDKAQRDALLGQGPRNLREDPSALSSQARDAAITTPRHAAARASPRKRQEAHVAGGRCRLNIANVDFMLALAQPTQSERNALFGKVAKEFERHLPRI